MMDIVNTMFEAGMETEGMAALKKIENMETSYADKRKGMEGGWNPFAHSDEDYSALQPTGMNKAQREAKEAQLNQAAKGETGQDTSYDTSERDSSFFSRHRTEGTPSYNNQQNQTQTTPGEISGAMPHRDAPKAPSFADVEAKALAKKKAQRERLDAIGDSGPAMYGDARRKDRLDFSDALLSPEERRRVGMQGHFTGLK